ncbi:DUF484 family protein [Pseudoalteromonas xiamenensis]|uniref:DUF484 family protein n=1 Tax=Pseudoalteromonas xiamenensis TaxID=882626 RepID=UPI0035E54312
MSEQPLDKKVVTELQEHQVAAYLSRHPDFFRHHPYLLLELELHSDATGLPNLALQQQRLLREQTTELKTQIAQLIRYAKDNERVFKLFSECQRALWQCQSFAQLSQLVQTKLSEVPTICGCELLEFELRFTALVANRLNRRGNYLGRLSKDEQSLFFNKGDAQSVALYLLGDLKAPKAILALASTDPDHFAPDNDNLLINEFLRSLEQRLTELA